MLPFKAEFLRYLDEKGIKYRDIDDVAVRVGYNADNAGTIDVVVIFDSNGKNYVSLNSWSIGQFTDDNYSKGIIVCNEMNAQYRWCKFFLNSDKKVTVQIDAVVEMNTVGAEVLELVRRIVHIADEAYPAFMKARWA